MEWAALTDGRRATTAILVGEPPGLRPDLTADEVIDTVWTVASPETCDLLVRHAGYSFDAYERWVADTLVGVLLPRRR